MEVKKLECETLIVGAGSAGIEAYKSAVAAGADCIIVDTGPLGTTAQRSGELPLSLLMSAGQALHSISTLSQSGIKFPSDINPDTSNVLSSLRAVRAHATSEVLSFMYRIPESKRIRGRARFLTSNSAQVDDHTVITFKTAVIATGSSPLVTYEQSRLKKILTTNEFFELDELPKSVAIFGSSKIGLQLGQALSYLGVNVAVFGQRKLWNLTNDTVLTVANQILSEKFNLYVDTFITSIEESDEGYSIYYIDEKGYENYLHMQSVVAATDRTPNIGGMNLQSIGVKLTRTGCIRVDASTQQSSVPNIFAAGDVCHDTHLSSLAISEGKCAGINAANYPLLSMRNPPVKIDIVFTDPVLATVGMTMDELRNYASKTGDTFIGTEVKLSQGHYRGLREDGGILSLYVSTRSHLVLGAEICAFMGDKIAQLVAFAIRNSIRVDEIAEYAFYNLSVESAVGIAARQALTILSKESLKIRL